GGAREFPFHVEPGKRVHDCGDLRLLQGVVPKPGPIEANACRTQNDLDLLVEGDGRRRVERDAVPDELRAAIIETFFARESARGIGPFDLEAQRSVERFGQAEVVQYSGDGQNLAVVRLLL